MFFKLIPFQLLFWSFGIKDVLKFTDKVQIA